MIDEKIIKYKKDIKETNVSITYSATNGVVTIDTTKKFCDNVTYSDVSIYKTISGRTIVTYSYQRVKSAAQLKELASKFYSKSAIETEMESVGVNENDYKIVDSNDGFFKSSKPKILFRNQKIILKKKTRMFIDCKDYCIIS